MPCDSIQTSIVDLGKIGDRQLLVAALKMLGYSDARLVGTTVYFGVQERNGGVVFSTGTMELWGAATSLTEAAVKQAYGNAAVVNAAEAFGWSVEKTANNEYELVKTSY